MDFDPKKNYYELLWVSESATTDEIKKAFKKAAIKHHPDKQWWDQKKFQEVNEAHQVLSDEKKRQQYDYYRKNWVDPSAFGGFGWWADFWWFGGWGFDFDIWDLLGWMFGGGGWFDGFWWSSRGKWNRNGEDIKIAVEISFEDSFLWVNKKVSYNKFSKVSGVEERTCSVCSGRGKVTKQMSTPFWVVQTQAACDHCGWAGKQYFKNGKEIWNFWLEKDKETVEVKVPGGIKDGTFIKFTGKWNAWIWTWHDGDLFIRIDVASSNIYERKWDNIYVKANVSIFDLVLWWEISVDHPEWKMKVKVPKWTQIHDMIKIASKWFWEKWLFAKKWDMYIIPKLDIPKKLSKEEEKLRSQLKKMK